MKVKGGPNKACAACKFQRRRCSVECSLAPFFPADQPKIFHNVHRLFGVSKVVKILRKMKNNSQKVDAMKSIIYESNVRDKFPVDGCAGLISQLHFQLQQTMEELQYVRAQLALYRENNSPSLQNINYFDFVSENDTGVYDESGETTNPFFNLNQFSDVISDHVKPIEIQTELGGELHAYGNKHEGETLDQQDCDCVHFYAIDDECKEACESSSESSSKCGKQGTEFISKNELRNAASCFSLMSLN